MRFHRSTEGHPPSKRRIGVRVPMELQELSKNEKTAKTFQNRKLLFSFT